MLLRMPTRSSFFCKTGPEGLLPADAQLGRDDARERRLAEAGRPVEQHVIHGLAAVFGGLDRNRQILLHPGLSGEVGQTDGAKRGFKLPLLFAQRRRYNALFPHEVLVYLPNEFERAAEQRIEIV